MPSFWSNSGLILPSMYQRNKMLFMLSIAGRKNDCRCLLYPCHYLIQMPFKISIAISHPNFRYESSEAMTIMVSTKVCSFGKQVVEKVEVRQSFCHCQICFSFCLFFQTEYSHFNNGRFVFRIDRSPMCEYMINFVHKLKQLPEKYMMNSVLENFTILQVSCLFIPDDSWN